jgi:hypothetical protein
MGTAATSPSSSYRTLSSFKRLLSQAFNQAPTRPETVLLYVILWVFIDNCFVHGSVVYMGGVVVFTEISNYIPSAPG